MEKLLISACLIGANCKYSGGNNFIGEDALRRLREKYELVSVCPETAGGLSTPRSPSERIGNRVMNDCEEDVTGQYRLGAQVALKLCVRFSCRKALLKENSPSCGSGMIYDGTFSHKLIPGDGVTAELLKAHGVEVCGETKLEELL